METHINHIKTPVHGLVELEFSIFRLLLKDESGSIVLCQTFKRTFQADDLRALKLLSLKVSVWPACAALVPDQFVVNNQSDLLKLTNGDLSQLLIKEQGHDHIEQTLLYGISSSQQMEVLQAYPGAQLVNAVSKLVTLCHVNMLKDVLYAHIENQRLWIVAKKNGQLIICNVYNRSNVEESLYYISAVTHQFFDQKVPLFLSGNDLDAHQNLLKSYFYHVNLLSVESPSDIHAASYYQLLTES